jgi:hypothetical protein
MTRQDTLPSRPSPSRQNGLAFGGLSLAEVRDLLLPQPAPCLTLSLPTHRNVPENRVDLALLHTPCRLTRHGLVARPPPGRN